MCKDDWYGDYDSQQLEAYECWLKKPAATLEECVCLVRGGTYHDDDGTVSSSWDNKHGDFYTTMVKPYVLSGKLPVIRLPEDKPLPTLEPEEITVEPAVFYKWCKEMNVRVPEELEKIYSRIIKDNTLVDENTSIKIEKECQKKLSAVSMQNDMQSDKVALAKKWKEEGKAFIQMDLSKELAKYEKYKHIAPTTIEKLTRKA